MTLNLMENHFLSAASLGAVDENRTNRPLESSFNGLIFIMRFNIS
jgi:hypothetical protein